MHTVTDGATAVAVVGLGAMGGPIARSISAAGWAVTGFDRTASAATALAPAGITAAGSLDEAARCPVMLLFVPTDDDVVEVAEQLARGTGRPRRLVICSSVKPQTCERVASVASWAVVVDAALTGGVRAAEQGQVNLLVGGPEAAVNELRPVFAAFCATVHHLGRLGSGQVGKTVNNMLHWAEIAAIVEALDLGQALGVPAWRMREALYDGPTDGRTLHELEQFRLTWWTKDIDNALAMASQHGFQLPVSRLVRELMADVSVERLRNLVARGPL